MGKPVTTNRRGPGVGDTAERALKCLAGHRAPVDLVDGPFGGGLVVASRGPRELDRSGALRGRRFHARESGAFAVGSRSAGLLDRVRVFVRRGVGGANDDEVRGSTLQTGSSADSAPGGETSVGLENLLPRSGRDVNVVDNRDCRG